MANTQLVTTGLVPLTIGSIERFQHQGFLGGVPWDFTGGTVNLIVADPSGNKTTYPATIAGMNAYVDYTVVAPAGDWKRAWSVVDANGITQVSRPIPFGVESSPV